MGFHLGTRVPMGPFSIFESHLGPIFFRIPIFSIFSFSWLLHPNPPCFNMASENSFLIIFQPLQTMMNPAMNQPPQAMYSVPQFVDQVKM